MFNSNTDREWEKFGKSNPYFGVITHDKYMSINLTDERKEEFFSSGYNHIERVLMKIRKHIDPDFTVKRALDFGCGVGRLVIPIAEIAESVTGVEVSESMLREAGKNCEIRSLKNVNFIKCDEEIPLLNDKYNFIHSFIVFQHISVKRGERILKYLIARLEDGGCCVVHFTYAKDFQNKKLIPFIINYFPLARNIFNIIKGRSFFSPVMQMNNYDLNRLFFIIQKTNVCELYTEFTDHGGNLGILMYFKKPEKA